MIRSRLRAFAAAGLVLAGSIAAVVVAAPAAHAEVVCDQYGTRLIQNGRYVVQNNRWGASTTQCVDVTSTGSRIRVEITDGADVIVATGEGGTFQEFAFEPTLDSTSPTDTLWKIVRWKETGRSETTP